MPALKAFYSDHFVLPLPAGHRFPMQKYRLLRERAAGVAPGIDFVEAPDIGNGVLALAHSPDYIRRVSFGELSAEEQRASVFHGHPAWSSVRGVPQERPSGPAALRSTTALR